MKNLSIVIPAYNEEANLANTVDKISDIARGLGCDYEIIIVNDGSRDRMRDIARELGLFLPKLRLVEHYPNRGYGGALKSGFSAAIKEWITFIPGDGQFDFSEIHQLLDYTLEAEVICGYRTNRQDPFIRRMNTFGWNSLVSLLFGPLARDIDCGFKLFRRDVLTQIHMQSDGAMVDTEFLAGAKVRGYRIIDVPVTHLPRVAGEPTGANFRVILKAFRDLLAFRLRLSAELREFEKQVEGVA